MSTEKAGYKRTFLDRYGAEGLMIIRIVALSIPFAIVTGIYAFLTFRNRGFVVGAFAGLVTAALTLAAVSRLALGVANAGGNFFARFIWPTGETTPYQADNSFEKALIMQGRSTEALESYEEKLRVNPADAALHIEAADTNAAHGKPQRAVELFRTVRLIEAVSGSQKLYATNRLIDLYSGAAADEEKERSELRYILAHFPDSRAATLARTALERRSNT